jgi:hypothetical protein
MKHIKLHPILESNESIEDFKESYSIIQEFFNQIEDEYGIEIKLLKAKIYNSEEKRCPFCDSDSISSKGYNYNYGSVMMECDDCDYESLSDKFISEEFLIERVHDFSSTNVLIPSSEFGNLKGIHSLKKDKIEYLRNILSYYNMDIYDISLNLGNFEIKGKGIHYSSIWTKNRMNTITIITTKKEYDNFLEISKEDILKIELH